MGQAMVPEESRVDLSVHGFWKWVTSSIFYIQIVNLYESFYLRQTSLKALETAEKEKKEKHL